MEKKNPYETQIGGDHYSKMPMQPLYFARANNLKPELLKAIKYIIRLKSVEEDKRKACHVLDLYVENQKKFPKNFLSWLIAESKVSMEDFVHENAKHLTWSRMAALYALQDVIYCMDRNLQKHVDKCKVKIMQIQ